MDVGVRVDVDVFAGVFVARSVLVRVGVEVTVEVWVSRAAVLRIVGVGEVPLENLQPDNRTTQNRTRTTDTN